MKLAIRIAIFSIVFPLFSLSQTSGKEFEGIIKYKHTVIAKDTLYDTNYDYSAIGYKSEFYYKAGDYKFTNHDCYFKADLFICKEPRNYLLLENSDSVLCINSKIADAEIIDYSINNLVDTILGNPCSLITVKLKSADKKFPISYRRYYYSSKLAVDPKHFLGCKANAYELIYAKAKALALRIEFEWHDRIVRWDAYEVKTQNLSADIFKKENSWILAFIN